MATRYERRNATTIRNAFTRLRNNKDRVIEEGMKDLLESAMLYALAEHDNHHWLHKSTADSYGWMLLHDGGVVAHKVNDGRHGEGNAYSDMMAVSNTVSQTGWVGILLASMHSEGPSYYSVIYEEGILEETADVTKENFGMFFNIIGGPASRI